jgi:hypothetical protein
MSRMHGGMSFDSFCFLLVIVLIYEGDTMHEGFSSNILQIHDRNCQDKTSASLCSNAWSAARAYTRNNNRWFCYKRVPCSTIGIGVSYRFFSAFENSSISEFLFAIDQGILCMYNSTIYILHHPSIFWIVATLGLSYSFFYCYSHFAKYGHIWFSSEYWKEGEKGNTPPWQLESVSSQINVFSWKTGEGIPPFLPLKFLSVVWIISENLGFSEFFFSYSPIKWDTEAMYA